MHRKVLATICLSRCESRLYFVSYSFEGGLIASFSWQSICFELLWDSSCWLKGNPRSIVFGEE